MYDKFTPFHKYVVNNIYPRIYKEPINVNVIKAQSEILKTKYNKDNNVYVYSSIIPQLKATLDVAISINQNIEHLSSNIKVFQEKLNRLNRLINIIKNAELTHDREEIAELSLKVSKNISNLRESTVCNDGVIEVPMEECEKLIQNMNTLEENLVFIPQTIPHVVKQLPELVKNINLYADRIFMDFTSYAAYFEEANDRIKYYEDEVNKNKMGIETE